MCAWVVAGVELWKDRSGVGEVMMVVVVPARLGVLILFAVPAVQGMESCPSKVVSIGTTTPLGLLNSVDLLRPQRRFRLCPVAIASLVPCIFISSSSNPASARIFSTSSNIGLYSADREFVEMKLANARPPVIQTDSPYRAPASPNPSRRNCFPRLSFACS